MLLSLPGRVPTAAATAWVADTARVVGSVHLDELVSVWWSAVLRGDGDTVHVGARTNLQEGCVLHADPGFPLRIGAGVSVGHAAVLHGCTVEDDVLVGMGAVVMNGARIGSGSMIGAGALVSPGTVVPPGSLVVGTPGKVRRETTAEERELIALNSTIYLELVETHRQAVQVHR